MTDSSMTDSFEATPVAKYQLCNEYDRAVYGLSLEGAVKMSGLGGRSHFHLTEEEIEQLVAAPREDRWSTIAAFGKASLLISASITPFERPDVERVEHRPKFDFFERWHKAK